mmetsp:Transcript_22673/g.57760  ORF Transcript_22673/g.57760 Transcript_22673/m.57760 type:complete len:238 (+) Transcript_22673:150-863(+)
MKHLKCTMHTEARGASRYTNSPMAALTSQVRQLNSIPSTQAATAMQATMHARQPMQAQPHQLAGDEHTKQSQWRGKHCNQTRLFRVRVRHSHNTVPAAARVLDQASCVTQLLPGPVRGVLAAQPQRGPLLVRLPLEVWPPLAALVGAVVPPQLGPLHHQPPLVLLLQRAPVRHVAGRRRHARGPAAGDGLGRLGGGCARGGGAGGGCTCGGHGRSGGACWCARGGRGCRCCLALIIQ